MYNIFMTNTLIDSQLGHRDRSIAMSNTGIIDARQSAHRRIAARFARKKS